jgi:ABC-type branched-subunit amino acid transport system substrate-binding protein
LHHFISLVGLSQKKENQLKFVFVSVIAICISHTILAQQSERELFNEAVKDYKTENYNRAQTSFFKILQTYPEGKLKTATKLMLAKSYYKLDAHQRLAIICNNFIQNHPNSNYLDDIHHLYGNSYFKIGQYEAAIGEWNWVVNNAGDPQLKKLDGEYLYNAVDQNIDVNELNTLEKKSRDNIFQGLVKIIKAKKSISMGNVENGNRMLRDFLDEQPHHFYAEKAKDILFSSSSKYGITNNFIYFKPAEGELSELGDQIEKGMKYAVSEYKTRNQDENISFQAVELENNMSNALLTVNRKLIDTNPTCLIGPINADQCAGLAMLSKYEKRPYIIPLSSETGFTQLSPYTFQLNPDVESKGRFLGEYAVNDMELKKFAILAPVNEYGRGFVRSFAESVQANGGEVVSDQWYYLDTQDFTRQFKAIRKKGFQIEFETLLQETDSTINEEDYQNEFKKFMEQKFEDVQFGQDSTQIPATGIDAILILTTPSFIPFLASQFAFHNIQCTLLGNEGWNDAEQLKKFQQYIEGIVYITAAYFDSESWNYKEFTNRYRLQMNETPEYYNLLGYDVMKWILQNYQPGMSLEELKNKLENANLYQGILQNIEFGDKPRINNQLKVMKFSFGKFIRLK